MTQNVEYEKANIAIEGYKNGVYSSLDSAAISLGADATLMAVMLSNPAMGETNFASNLVQQNRFSICSECEKNQNNTCIVCACPINFVTSVQTSTCPEGRW
jgi:hypothetical protein